MVFCNWDIQVLWRLQRRSDAKILTRDGQRVAESFNRGIGRVLFRLHRGVIVDTTYKVFEAIERVHLLAQHHRSGAHTGTVTYMKVSRCYYALNGALHPT